MKPSNTLPIHQVPWSLGDTAKGILVVAVAIVFLAAFVGPLLLLLRINTGTLGLLLSLAIEGALLLAVWRFGPWKYGRSWEALGLRRGLYSALPWALLAFSGIFGFSILYTLLVAGLGIDSLLPPGLPDEISKGVFNRVLGFGVTVLVAPFVEEVFFRGFLLPVFVAHMGFMKGATVVSLLFALGHLSVGLLIPAFASGMVLAWVYHSTGSLRSSWLAHGIQNALAFTVAVATA